LTGEEVLIKFTPVNEANQPLGAGEINNEDLEPAQKTEKTSALSTFTWLIIIFGGTGFLILVALTIVALRRGLRTKADSPVAVTPVKLDQKKVVNDLEKNQE